MFVTWTAASGATNYNIYRSSNGSTFTLLGSSGTTFLNDPTVAANTSYLYKVRSFNGLESADSNVDLATTVIFTDPTLTAGGTVVKAVHFTQPLTAVNAVRALAGQSAISFTAPAPASGVTVFGAHMTYLRNGLTGPIRGRPPGMMPGMLRDCAHL